MSDKSYTIESQSTAAGTHIKNVRSALTQKLDLANQAEKLLFFAVGMKGGRALKVEISDDDGLSISFPLRLLSPDEVETIQLLLLTAAQRLIDQSKAGT